MIVKSSKKLRFFKVRFKSRKWSCKDSHSWARDLKYSFWWCAYFTLYVCLFFFVVVFCCCFFCVCLFVVVFLLCVHVLFVSLHTWYFCLKFAAFRTWTWMYGLICTWNVVCNVEVEACLYVTSIVFMRSVKERECLFCLFVCLFVWCCLFFLSENRRVRKVDFKTEMLSLKNLVEMLT